MAKFTKVNSVFTSCYCVYTGAVPRVVRPRVRHVRVDPELLGVLRAELGDASRHRVHPHPQRDHLRLRPGQASIGVISGSTAAAL